MEMQGCGVVTFATQEEARNAMATLNDSVLQGRKIFVREDRETEERQPPATVHVSNDGNGKTKQGHVHPGTRVYVGNLAWNVKWQDLKDHMKQVGSVVHADGTVRVGTWL